MGKKNTVKVLCFVFIFICLFSICEDVFTEKWTGRETDRITDKYEGFYELPCNSLDYIVLGISHSWRSLNPILVYARNGYAGYNLGGPMQTIELSYYWLQEACKYQNPKYVFLDVGSLFYDGGSVSEGYIVKGITDMKLSLLKLKAAYECKLPEMSVLGLASPMYRFHDRWKDLKREDFNLRKHYDSFGGTYFSFVTSRYTSKITATKTDFLVYKDGDYILQRKGIGQQNANIFRKIYYFCQEKGIVLVPVKGPTIYWGESEADIVNEFLADYALKLLDMNVEETDIVWDTDTYDNGGHVNYWGNCKASYYLAKYLEEENTLYDHRENTGYALWNTFLQEYEQYEEESLWTNKEKILSYFQVLENNKEDVCIVISGKDDVCLGWADELQVCVERFGLQSDFYSNVQNSYVGIIDEGNVIVDRFTDYPLRVEMEIKFRNKEWGGVIAESGGYMYGNYSEISIMGESCSINGRGLNIVVIDKDSGKVISSVSVDTSSNEWGFEEEILDENIWSKCKERGMQIFEDGVYRICSSADENYVLCVSNTEDKDSNVVCVEEKNEGLEQLFKIQYCGNCIYMIQSMSSGGYLAVEKFRNSSGTHIIEEAYTGLSNQKWYIYRNKDGYTIMSHYNSLVMDAAKESEWQGEELRMWENCSEKWQQFYLKIQ